MKVLVTGAAGYIGSVLCQHLLNCGHEVVGVDSLVFSNGHAILSLLGHKRFCFYPLDVRQTAMEVLVNQCDAVIHLAALVGAPLCDKQPAEARDVNYESVRQLMKMVSPDHRILFPNTNSGYGQTDGTKEVTEEDVLAPVSLYGRTKCEAENVILNHPNAVAFRLATVFGASPRMRFDLMVNDFTSKLYFLKNRLNCFKNGVFSSCTREDLEFSIFEPHFKRNFVHVRDVCRAFTYALDKRAMKGVYNLGLPSANLTKLELAHKICEVVGVSREAIITAEGRDPDQRNYLVSNDKVLRAGFVFRHELDAR